MKALIVGNRPLKSDIIDLAKDSFIIAADGGADRLLKYNITPDWIIGDLDSVSKKTMSKLKEWTITNKNLQKTDLEKAVDYAFERGAKKVEIVGWTGGRIDHTMATLGLAFDSRIKLIGEKFIVYSIEETKTIKGPEKTIFSLIAMPEARVSVYGARWNLEHEKIKLGGRGIHNEIGPSGEVRIDCHSGNLLIVEGNSIFPHD